MSAVVVPDYHELAARLETERQAGRSVALANGCFDVVHVGHVRLITAAKGEADVLVVALNDDASARRHKGEGRPFVPLEERMEVMAAFDGVSFVTSFGEDTVAELLRVLRPHALVKGTDRTPDTVPEKPTCEELGVRIVIAGDPKTHSSTELGGKSRT